MFVVVRTNVVKESDYEAHDFDMVTAIRATLEAAVEVAKEEAAEIVKKEFPNGGFNVISPDISHLSDELQQQYRKCMPNPEVVVYEEVGEIDEMQDDGLYVDPIYVFHIADCNNVA